MTLLRLFGINIKTDHKKSVDEEVIVTGKSKKLYYYAKRKSHAAHKNKKHS